MPLSVRSGYEELLHKLEEIRDQGYYYVGESVFAGSHRDWNRVNVDSFHLWDIPHGDELDRIVMLFADFSASKAAMLMIEGRRVCRTESANGRFLMDAFKAMEESVAAERVEDIDYDGITAPVRLIYQKPLFLTLLYRCNLLLEGHDLLTLIHTNPEQRASEKRKDKDVVESIRQELRDYFELDQWEERIDFRDSAHDHDSLTKQISECVKYLDGLSVIRQTLSERKDVEIENTGIEVCQQRCQQIDDMICVVKDKLRQLVWAARMELPFVAPEKTIALWHVGEAFPGDMCFAEMVSIRTQLECTLDDLRRQKPEADAPKRCQLWDYRVGVVYMQIYQMEKLLEEKLQDHELEWEDYLV